MRGRKNTLGFPLRVRTFEKMNSQKQLKKAIDFADSKSEIPIDPFVGDFFGVKKSAASEVENLPDETNENALKNLPIAENRRPWFENLPRLKSREVEFSRLFKSLPENFSRAAVKKIGETVARYTLRRENDVKCSLVAVSEVNLKRAIDKLANTSQVFLTLGCQPTNAAAVITFSTYPAASLIDSILGSQDAEFIVPHRLSPIENVIIEFLGINILNGINDWLGQNVLCLQSVSDENQVSFDASERGAETVINLNFEAFNGIITVFSTADFLNGLSSTPNSLFKKKSVENQFETYEKIAPKLNLRLPVGTTRLSADSLLYLEADDIMLVEEPNANWTDGKLAEQLQIYAGSGNNFVLTGNYLPEETEIFNSLMFKINEISSKEEKRGQMPAILKMDEKEEKEDEETEENAPEEAGQSDEPPEEIEETETNAAALANILVNLRVEIAGDKISIGELQNFRPGQIIALGCRPTDPVRIVTDGNDQPVALGELVNIEGKLGVRLTKIFI